MSQAESGRPVKLPIWLPPAVAETYRDLGLQYPDRTRFLPIELQACRRRFFTDEGMKRIWETLADFDERQLVALTRVVDCAICFRWASDPRSPKRKVDRMKEIRRHANALEKILKLEEPAPKEGFHDLFSANEKWWDLHPLFVQTELDYGRFISELRAINECARIVLAGRVNELKVAPKMGTRKWNRFNDFSTYFAKEVMVGLEHLTGAPKYELVADLISLVFNTERVSTASLRKLDRTTARNAMQSEWSKIR